MKPNCLPLLHPPSIPTLAFFAEPTLSLLGDIVLPPESIVRTVLWLIRLSTFLSDPEPFFVGVFTMILVIAEPLDEGVGGMTLGLRIPFGVEGTSLPDSLLTKPSV